MYLSLHSIGFQYFIMLSFNTPGHPWQQCKQTNVVKVSVLSSSQ